MIPRNYGTLTRRIQLLQSDPANAPVLLWLQGKYIPAVGAALHENAPFMRVNINFRGIAYGNGLTDPVNMMAVGEFAHEIGLLDRTAADYMNHTCEAARKAILAGRTGLAFNMLDRLFIGITSRDTFLMNTTGFHYTYNLLHDKEPAGVRNYEQFVPLEGLRRAIHVGKRNFSTSRDAVMSRFVEDFLRSAVAQLTVLLEDGYRVLVYSGQLDLAVPTTQTENFLSQLHWSGTSRWARARQRQWRSFDGEKLYGYTKSVDNLHFAVVRNSGHMVPHDTPEAAFSLITAFVDGSEPFEE
ncbi:hypothetical protein HPB48_022292 [Haemaphysalis longicornis]|uniref:Serine carboxypeptidase n=1 Tax=Haemaphysalis longicornis TaxID=44386 RepID=A0A9J6FXQ8_HAELO|nr:hypothetical protein HPB48_022292 [Haemaphysalis longicornis]